MIDFTKINWKRVGVEIELRGTQELLTIHRDAMSEELIKKYQQREQELIAQLAEIDLLGDGETLPPS